MRSTLRTVALATLSAAALGLAVPALGEDAAPAVGSRPERGTHMRAIEAQYGAPAARYPAVGKPPITRWDYPGFIVYFEGDRLIHAVLVTPEG